MTNEQPKKLDQAALVAALPRMLGYIPRGRIAVAMLAGEGKAKTLSTVAAVDHRADAALSARHLVQAVQHLDPAPTQVLVIGWADDAPVDAATVDLADALVFEGVEVVQTLVVDRAGHGLRDLSTGVVRLAAKPEQVEGIDQLGPAPVGDRAALAQMWRPMGVLTPTDHRLSWVKCWEAVLWGEATNAQIEQAAHALNDPAQRDRILIALTGLALGETDLGDAAALVPLRVTTKEGAEVLRDVVTRLAADRDSVPMLTLVLGITWTVQHGAQGVLAEQVERLDPHGTHHLGVLLCKAITAGLNPANLRT